MSHDSASTIPIHDEQPDPAGGGKDHESDPQADPVEEGQQQENAPVTEPEESNPNADGPDGLAGELGVSSERTGPVRGSDGESVTYGANPTHVDEPEDPDPLPEQSPRTDVPEINPDPTGDHPFDPDKNPRHGV